MKNTRTETNYNKLVAKKGSGYYVLDYIFEDGDFKGSTWSIFEAITEEGYEERIKNYDFDELWKMAVEADQTTSGLNEWINYMDDYEIEEIVFDISYEGESQYEEVMKVAKKEIGNIKRLNCVGGGRSVSFGDEFDIVYDKKLLREVMRVEK